MVSYAFTLRTINVALIFHVQVFTDVLCENTTFLDDAYVHSGKKLFTFIFVV